MDNQISYLSFNKNLNVFNLNSENIKTIIKKSIKKKSIVFGSGGSNNIIIIKTLLNLVIKITPTIKNNLLKKQYNNDLFEINIYKKLTNEFPNITPHIVYCYRHYIINDVSIILPSKCLTLDQKLVLGKKKIDENNEHLCMLKNKYNKNLLDNKLNIITLEYCSTNISNYFESILLMKDNKLKIKFFIYNLNRIIFQVLFTLAVIQDKYPDFIHNDLFLRNILAIEESKWNNNDYVQYNFNNKSYYLPANGIYIKITDFGYSLNILNNNSTLVDEINNDVQDLFEIKNPLRDVYTFFYDLYDGANLGSLSLTTIINKYSKNKENKTKLIKILKNEIGKYFNYSKVDKYKNNYNIDWEWNISDSNILKSTIKKPNEYFNTNVFNIFIVKPKDANIIKTFN